MFLLQLAYYGDLLLPKGSWVSYAPQAHIIGRPIQWIHTDSKNDYKIDSTNLEKICKSDPSRPRLLILNYPCNPTGATYTENELNEIAQVARKYNLLVLADMIYAGRLKKQVRSTKFFVELDHNGNSPSISKYYPEGTIISGGMSKYLGAGGWR